MTQRPHLHGARRSVTVSFGCCRSAVLLWQSGATTSAVTALAENDATSTNTDKMFRTREPSFGYQSRFPQTTEISQKKIACRANGMTEAGNSRRKQRHDWLSRSNRMRNARSQMPVFAAISNAIVCGPGRWLANAIRAGAARPQATGTRLTGSDCKTYIRVSEYDNEDKNRQSSGRSDVPRDVGSHEAAHLSVAAGR